MYADTFRPYPKDKQIQPTKPTKAPAPKPKPKPTKPAKRRRHLTKAERAAYTEATTRARCADGYIKCESCSKPLLDHQAQRHHVIYRSQGGPTIAENLLIVCPRCHEAIHSHRGDA